ncbi:MAG: helix-turn-helix domain-containing protein [Candidatus Endonucleobacter bathymodioli]|uniref:Helix-turn-helix domain-containing protein n=1 Tax=Candidatus Endonucleibacter bathymodioli TaxID=539814 RepID=A0AA90SXJ0_9GAMM|nr:helix-turn-helix domain-containing protein [Candidatus Endonucleobacter bathymodioli]
MTGYYQQLTYEQRCQISVLKNSGCTQREVAKIIGVSHPTVSRELARNMGDRGYRHKQAQAKAIQRRHTAVKPTKMTPAMIIVIEAKLRIEWSPEQVSGWLLYDQEKLISHETIYRHIWAISRREETFIRICATRARNTTNGVTANLRGGR